MWCFCAAGVRKVVAACSQRVAAACDCCIGLTRVQPRPTKPPFMVLGCTTLLWPVENVCTSSPPPTSTCSECMLRPRCVRLAHARILVLLCRHWAHQVCGVLLVSMRRSVCARAPPLFVVFRSQSACCGGMSTLVWVSLLCCMLARVEVARESAVTTEKKTNSHTSPGIPGRSWLCVSRVRA